MKVIELTKGQVAIVDDEDFEKLAQYNWSIDDKGYAIRTVKKKKIFMHIEILGKSEGKIIDHRNRVTTDNRRENLRHCTKAENNRNSCKRKSDQTPSRGITIKDGKFRVRIGLNGKRIHIGYFDTLEEAKQKYAQASIEFHAEFSPINEQHNGPTPIAIKGNEKEQSTRARITNKLGIGGVRYRAGKFESRIFANGKQITLGRFDSIEGAKMAYQRERQKINEATLN